MVLIEISSICNLNCKTCPRRKRKGKQGHMSLEMFKEITDKIIDSKFENSLFLSGFGESLLNPHFFDMIKYAKSKGCKLIMPTNCTHINENNVKWLRLIDLLQLSIDSLKDEKRRTIKPQKILDLIPLLRKYHINFMFNVALGKENWNEVDNFLLLNTIYHIPINFIAIKPIFKGDKFLFDEMKFLATKTDEIKRKIETCSEVYFDESCRSFEYGRMRNNDFAVSWNGELFPCSFAFFREFSFGNIKDYSNLNGFWISSEIQKVRNGNHPICDFCKLNDMICNQEFSKPIPPKSVEEFHNIHLNKRCFVIGCGRSVTKEILEELKNEITVSANGIVFAKTMWGFEPNFFCASDTAVFTIPEIYSLVKTLKCPIIATDFILHQEKVLGRNFKTPFKEMEKILFNENIKKFSKSCYFIKWKFSQDRGGAIYSPEDISLDLNKQANMAGSVIQDLAIPFAYWIGCREIYLVGCDCDNEGHFFDSPDIKSYVSTRIKHQYKYYQEKLKDNGATLYNLSPSIIPHIQNLKFEEVFKK